MRRIPLFAAGSGFQCFSVWGCSCWSASDAGVHRVEDHLWTMRAARKLDASGFEKKRRREQANFEMRMVEMKRIKVAKRKEAADSKQRELDSIPFIVGVENIERLKLTGKKLDVQLDKLRLMWGPQVQISKKKDVLKVALKRDALMKAWPLHLQLLRNGATPARAQLDGFEDVEVVEMTVEAWHEDDDEEMDETD
ncbi:hypothetical protein BDZ89DRAFT_1179475 [Hymenopellis radicata]|nr:hypothetical protein BDZ89DRAFT_1179475 [Hymenopellis radicata]